MYKSLDNFKPITSRLEGLQSTKDKVKHKKQNQFSTISKLQKKSVNLQQVVSYNTLKNSRIVNSQSTQNNEATNPVIGKNTVNDLTDNFPYKNDDTFAEQNDIKLERNEATNTITNHLYKQNNLANEDASANYIKFDIIENSQKNCENTVKNLKVLSYFHNNQFNNLKTDKTNKGVKNTNAQNIDKMYKSLKKEQNNKLDQFNKLTTQTKSKNLNGEYINYNSLKQVGNLSNKIEQDNNQNTTLKFENKCLSTKTQNTYAFNSNCKILNQNSNTRKLTENFNYFSLSKNCGIIKEDNNKPSKEIRLINTTSIEDQLEKDDSLFQDELNEYMDLCNSFSDGYTDEETISRKKKKPKLKVSIKKDNYYASKGKHQSELLKNEIIFDSNCYEKYKHLTYTENIDPEYLSKCNVTFKKKSVCHKLSISGQKVVVLDVLNKNIISDTSIETHDTTLNADYDLPLNTEKKRVDSPLPKDLGNNKQKFNLNDKTYIPEKVRPEPKILDEVNNKKYLSSIKLDDNDAVSNLNNIDKIYYNRLNNSDMNSKGNSSSIDTVQVYRKNILTSNDFCEENPQETQFKQKNKNNTPQNLCYNHSVDIFCNRKSLNYINMQNDIITSYKNKSLKSGKTNDHSYHTPAQEVSQRNVGKTSWNGFNNRYNNKSNADKDSCVGKAHKLQNSPVHSNFESAFYELSLNTYCDNTSKEFTGNF